MLVGNDAGDGGSVEWNKKTNMRISCFTLPVVNSVFHVKRAVIQINWRRRILIH
jgi:hypothetical protein